MGSAKRISIRPFDQAERRTRLELPRMSVDSIQLVFSRHFLIRYSSSLSNAVVRSSNIVTAASTTTRDCQLRLEFGVEPKVVLLA